VNISEETKNARKVVPKAIVLSLLISSVLYVLASISIVSVIDWRVIGASEAPLEIVADKILGSMSPLMSFIILLSTGGTVLILLITGSRIIYGLSDAGRLPKFPLKRQQDHRHPHFAILLSTLVILAFVIMQNIEFVAKVSDFTAFFVFGMVNLSNIMLRYKSPGKREFKAR